MKLVDILARELKVWPEGDFESMGQGEDGALCKFPWSISRGWGWTKEKYTLSEESSSYVTRAQWQAAVDALKDEVRPTESMALHHQEVGRITRQWNGEGLPSIGTMCEIKLGPKWTKVEVLAYFVGQPVVGWICAEGECVEMRHVSELRPIRTPEQIAADERDRSVAEMQKAITSAPVVKPLDSYLYALYDAGYRKFEIVDN